MSEKPRFEVELDEDFGLWNVYEVATGSTFALAGDEQTAREFACAREMAEMLRDCADHMDDMNGEIQEAAPMRDNVDQVESVRVLLARLEGGE